MSPSTRDRTKTRKARPKETGTLVGIRFQAEPLAVLDDWRRTQSDLPSRAEAARRLIELGLRAAQGEKPAKAQAR